MRPRWQYLFVLLMGVFLFTPVFTHAESWSQIGFATNSLNVVTPDIGNKDHILVSAQYSAVLNTGVYYTRNGGANWTRAALADYPCSEIKQNPKVRTEWWAACSAGLYHSLDDGNSFSKITGFVYGDNHISIARDGAIYIASSNAAYHSVDGLIWDKNTFANTMSTNAYIAVDPNNSSTAYVSRTGDNSGLYRTTDGGRSWSLISNVTQFRSGISGLYVLKDGSLCANYLTGGIAYSTNGGFSWTSFLSPDPIIKGETSRLYGAYQNFDDPDNIIVTNVGQNGSNPRVYSTEGMDSSKTKSYSLPGSLPSVAISQGVIFVSSGNSTFTKGVWSSEGIAVKPEYLTKYPIIIVPGILGSWQYVSGGKYYLDPIFHTYDNLINSIMSNGYTENVNLFSFPYNWRQDNHQSALQLKTIIDEAKVKSGLSKVKIVAHSMGGLVARDYAESANYENDIDSIIFLGTPHLGSPMAYQAWEAGEVGFGETGIVSDIIKYFLNEEATNNGYSGVADYVRKGVPSVSQLLPITNYLGWFETGSIFSYPTLYPRNTYLENLNINKDKISDRNIKVTNIVTGDIQTLVGLKLTTYLGLDKLWQDGIPKGYGGSNVGLNFGFGDGTVPTDSSTGVASERNIIKSKVSHSDLPKKAIDDVVKDLGLAVAKDGMVPDSTLKYLLIKAYSPVDFYVTTPSGKKIGYNKNGADFSEISGAFYSGAGSAAQFAMIPNPESGQYSIKTVGTGAGTYKIESTFIDDDKQTDTTKSYSGVTTIGSEQIISTNLDAANSTVTEKINDDKTPTTNINVVGGSKDYYGGNVYLTLSATDETSGVKETNYTVDGAPWQKYEGQLTLSGEGKHSISFRSTDYAGNEESLKDASFTIDKTAPKVTVSLNKTVFTRWETPQLSCEATDNVSGLKSSSIGIDGTGYSCKNAGISLKNATLGSHDIEYSATDNAGNSSTGKISYSVIVTYAGSQLDLSSLYGSHQLTLAQYLKYSVWLSVADIYERIRLTSLRNSMLDQLLKQLETEKTLRKIDVNAYNLIKEDILWLRNNKSI